MIGINDFMNLCLFVCYFLFDFSFIFIEDSFTVLIFIIGYDKYTPNKLKLSGIFWDIDYSNISMLVYSF